MNGSVKVKTRNQSTRPKCRAPLGHSLLYCQGALMPCLTKHAINSRFIFFRDFPTLSFEMVKQLR